MGELAPETLHAWSQAWGLGHDAARAAELGEALSAQMPGLAALWEIDVTAHELIPSPPAWSVDDR